MQYCLGARTTSQITWARRFYPLSLRPIKPECGSGDCSSTLVEGELCRHRLPRDIIHPEHDVQLTLGYATASKVSAYAGIVASALRASTIL